MAGAADLHATAVEVKDACVALLAQTAEGPVDTAFVSPGDPSIDCCPALFVHVAGIGEAATVAQTALSSGLRYSSGRVNLATIMVTFARCAPVVSADELPSAEALEAAAAETNEDAWMLWAQLFRMQEAGELFGLCDAVFFDSILPLPISGGCAGWQFTIRVEIPGFQLGGS